MWSHQRPQHGRAKRRDQNAALRPKWAEARLHTAPCLRVFDRVLSIAFDLAPAVLYFFERAFLLALIDDVDEWLWKAVYICSTAGWWLSLSLYIYFGSVEDLTALVWIRRRAFPVRLFICMFLAPIVPLVVFFVSFFERTSLSCLAQEQVPPSSTAGKNHTDGTTNITVTKSDQSPLRGGVQNHRDETITPAHQQLVAGVLANDVGEGRIDIEELPPDLWLALLQSFVATRLNLQLAESTPGHRLFLFSIMCGSIPAALWLLIMHAVRSSQTLMFSIAYFTVITTVWVNGYRLCTTFSVGTFTFFLALIQIDTLTAGYNLKQILAVLSDDRMGLDQFMTIWTAKSLVLCVAGVILYFIDTVTQLRYSKVARKKGRGRFIANHVLSNFWKLCGLILATPAIALTCESLKLTTVVILDSLQRPAPEHTPALAGLLSFVFRHTGKDGDTHDARTKHVMLAAARARKEQLIRMARDAPGGEVSPAAISMFKVCSCIEAVASNPATTAMDIVFQDTSSDLGEGVAIDKVSKEPGLTRRRCLKSLGILYALHVVTSTLLPFIDVFLGSTAWSDGLQAAFLSFIIVGFVVAGLCTPAFIRYARFRLETNRLTQFCPIARDLDSAWLKWVQSYNMLMHDQSDATTSAAASAHGTCRSSPAVDVPVVPPSSGEKTDGDPVEGMGAMNRRKSTGRSALPRRVVPHVAQRTLFKYLPTPVFVMCPLSPISNDDDVLSLSQFKAIGKKVA